MKQVVFFILGVLTVLALGAFQPAPAPVSYRVVRSRSTTTLEDHINDAAKEGCRFLQFQIFYGEPFPEAAAVMECPGE